MASPSLFCFDPQSSAAKRPERLPVVLAKTETAALLGCMAGLTKTMACLLYGSGFRLFECLRLRVKDIDFERHQILVRDGKGRKDRVVPLPSCVTAELRDQLKFAQSQHEQALARAAGFVEFPDALRLKYPNLAKQWAWQWVFPATRCYVDEETGERRRHHLHETVLQRAVRDAARAAGINKHVSCHTLRGIALPQICCWLDMTFEQFKSYLDTPASRPR